MSISRYRHSVIRSQIEARKTFVGFVLETELTKVRKCIPKEVTDLISKFTVKASRETEPQIVRKFEATMIDNTSESDPRSFEAIK